ncbi:MAG TPA: hypothetical protein DD850_07240 [Erwinia persicina]|uniref:Uncharacterized protein n=1 Tax=Erwinia persicina TaxID=55211 RepID=A0A357SUD4_9GAMM|nr:hypothetical protein [Erwinia persicina]AXU95493.1 hypothetical protein CI789_09775 [Erwinia persicina]MBC3945880.1 hypothetical protein [Erwinia persicina]MBD8105442.1 hypothetical protein [Erwinia persicina]MBD8166041.1 hypothetical protein [Erwinia persicina]MBD8208588.1 hypothetical protein [Erwinia persicina]
MATIYIPSLMGLLSDAERQKGTRLTREEVETLRDSVVCVTIPDTIASALDRSQNFSDTDPEHCWEEWSRYRYQREAAQR